MKNLLYLLIFSLLLGEYTKANELDSLLTTLTQQKKEDTNKVKTLFHLVEYYSDNYFDSSLYYIKAAEKLTKKLNTTDFDYTLYTAYAEYYYNQNDYQATISYLQKCKQIATKKNDKLLLSKVLNNLSATYSRFGQHRLAIEYGLAALNSAIELNDTINLSNRYATVCRIYNDLKEYPKSIEYGKMGIIYGERYKHANGTIISYNNVAASYSGLFKLDSSKYYQQQALNLALKNNNVFYIYASLINLSMNDFRTGKLNTIKSYSQQLSELIKVYDLKNNKSILAYQTIIKSLEFLAENKLIDAKKELVKGIKYAELESNNDALLSVYEMLSKIEYLSHNISDAENYYYKADSIQQTIYTRELNIFALDLNTKYETQKKQNEILKQKQEIKNQKIWIILLIGSTIILLTLSFFIFRYFKQKNTILEKERIIHQQHIQELEKEKQLQATEAILKGQEEERSRIAKDLHDGLGGLLSGVKYSLNIMKENVILSADNAASFTRSIDMLDTGIQELRRIAHSMMPENLVKFGLDTALKDYCDAITKTNVLRINYSSFQMENFKAESSESVIVYRIIQELINNTIKHANASELLVQLSKEDTTLYITVEDNGKGFDTTNIQHFKGAGWTNILNRINYLKGKLDVQSSASEGTSINIEIPLA